MIVIHISLITIFLVRGVVSTGKRFGSVGQSFWWGGFIEGTIEYLRKRSRGVSQEADRRHIQ